MILLIDHYDSFTYNLYQLMSELGKTVRVIARWLQVPLLQSLQSKFRHSAPPAPFYPVHSLIGISYT